MNENSLSTDGECADGDRITQARKEDDLSLATEAVREGYVRGWRAAAGNLSALVAVAAVVGMLVIQTSTPLGAYIILYAPMTVGLGFLVRGSILARRALARRQALPLWERHRIAMTLIQVAKDEVTR